VKVLETTVICPKCGEVNSSNFLFCGMCGTILEPVRKATAPVPAAPAAPRVESRPAPSTTPVSPAAPAAPLPAPGEPRMESQGPTPPISGPSVLGLNQPNVDVLRERAFSGLDKYGDDEPKSRSGRVVLMLLLLLALGGGYWWTYKNYLSVTEGRKPVASTAPIDPNASASNDTGPEALPPRKPAATLPPAVTPATPESKSRADSGSDKDSDTLASSPAAAASHAAAPTPTPTRHEVSAERVPAAKPAEADDAESLFRRGERSLYGRGGAQDCSSALKYLKMASDKQSAKARSAMGTMYATGHCVSRDLPSAYRWFALSLRADPNNSVVEKNLSAVWNQMTPPERQLATKSQ